MSVEDWARREADRIRREDSAMLTYDMEEDAFAAGIVHAFDALLSDEAVEAAAQTIPNRWEVDGRCWAEYAGGDEYCRSHFDTEAEAVEHRDRHHNAPHAKVWAHKEPEELLAEARAALQAAVRAVTEGGE